MNDSATDTRAKREFASSWGVLVLESFAKTALAVVKRRACRADLNEFLEIVPAANDHALSRSTANTIEWLAARCRLCAKCPPHPALFMPSPALPRLAG